MRTLVWDRQRAGVRAVNARQVDHLVGGGWDWHQHDYIECFCIDRGRLHHQWDDQQDELLPGDLIAVLPGEAHRATAGAGGARIINISCSGDALRWLRSRADGLATPWDGDRRARHHVLGQPQRDLLRAVVGSVDPTTAAGRDMILLTLVQVVHAATGATRQVPAWLERGLVAHLDAGDSRGIAGLAQRCGCSREHLARSVKASAGLTAVAWLRQRRVERAAQQLRTTEDDVRAIGLAAGFATQSAFYAAFRERYGMAPVQWRRRHRFDEQRD